MRHVQVLINVKDGLIQDIETSSKNTIFTIMDRDVKEGQGKVVYEKESTFVTADAIKTEIEAQLAKQKKYEDYEAAKRLVEEFEAARKTQPVPIIEDEKKEPRKQRTS